jgi:ribosomal protein S18 acetylase RimI-like enzyme
MTAEIRIQHGFSDEMRAPAAALYEAAFGAKLAFAIGNQTARQAILQHSFDPSFAIVAMGGGKMLGIAGFKTATGSLLGGLSWSVLRTELGAWGALRATTVLALLERQVTMGQLLMDGLGVAPEMRGRGVGTMLLQYLIRYARESGYNTLRLDVIDTNAGARRLYERLGFVALETANFPYLKWALGFAGATQMVYDLTAVG